MFLFRYISCLYLMNKVDLVSREELDLMHQDPNMVPISAHEQWCLDMLIEYFFLDIEFSLIYYNCYCMYLLPSLYVSTSVPVALRKWSEMFVLMISI